MNDLVERVRRAFSDSKSRELALLRLKAFRAFFRRCRADPAGFMADPLGIDRFLDESRIVHAALPDGAWPELGAIIDEIKSIASETRAMRLHMSSPAIRSAA